MRLFVGLDVSLAKTAICVVSEHGNPPCSAPFRQRLKDAVPDQRLFQRPVNPARRYPRTG